MGILGLAMARNLVDFLALVAILIILKRNKQFQKTFVKFTGEVWKNWINFLRVSFHMGGIMYLEQTFFEIQTIIIATIGSVN